MMTNQTKKSIKDMLKNCDDVKLAIVYGSAADDSQTKNSDLDLAVAGDTKLDANSKMELIEELALIAKRPIDLVDLQTSHGTLLKHILTKGEVIFKQDAKLYGNIIKRMLFDEADYMPYYYRTLKNRREQWIKS